MVAQHCDSAAHGGLGRGVARRASPRQGEADVGRLDLVRVRVGVRVRVRGKVRVEVRVRVRVGVRG